MYNRICYWECLVEVKFYFLYKNFFYFFCYKKCLDGDKIFNDIWCVSRCFEKVKFENNGICVIDC